MLALHPRGAGPGARVGGAPAFGMFINPNYGGLAVFKYLWMVIQDLFLTVTYATLMHTMLSRVADRRGRLLHGTALGLGVLASVALAIVKYNTKLIISSHWNHYIYAILMALTVLFLVLTFCFGRKEKQSGGAGPTILCVTGSLLSAVMIFYSLPGVLLYPFSFNTMGQGYLSSYYLVRMAGWLGALILLLIYSRLLSHCAFDIKPYTWLLTILNVNLLVFALYSFGRFFAPWVNRAKWLGWSVRYTDEAYGWIGNWMMFTANHSMLFIWVTVGLIVLLCIFFFRQGMILNEKYDNPAQLRKLKARNRHWRRMAVGTLVCIVLFSLILTIVKTNDTKQVELSAPENYTVDAEAGVILIPTEAVNDGHLHRFEYRTAKNIDVRWIVVKKPNSASYGVGLDACEVCGNAGYFERNGQVVCKRCDVVMNINTIGFKGGCNPIPLAYEVRDGNLVFRLEDLVAGEKEFK